MFKFNVFVFLSLNSATTKWPCSLNFEVRSTSIISCPWDEMSFSWLIFNSLTKLRYLNMFKSTFCSFSMNWFLAVTSKKLALDINLPVKRFSKEKDKVTSLASIIFPPSPILKSEISKDGLIGCQWIFLISRVDWGSIYVFRIYI